MVRPCLRRLRMGLFRKKGKTADAGGVGQLEDRAVTEADKEPVYKRQVRKADRKGKVSVGDILSFVRQKKEAETPDVFDHVFNGEPSETGGEYPIVEGQAGGAGTAGGQNIFHSQYEEEEMPKPAALPANIASAFGISDSLPDDSYGQETDGDVTREDDVPSGEEGGDIFLSQEAEEGQGIADAWDGLGIDGGDTQSLTDDIEDEPTLQDGDAGHDPASCGGEGTGECGGKASGNILKRLREKTRWYFHREVGSSDSVDLIYYDECDLVPKLEDGKFLLGSNKVYVNGELQHWDDVFEIKCMAGSVVEIETGVGFSIPPFCKLNVVCNSMADIHYFDPVEFDLDGHRASEPQVVRLVAKEGAYLSKMGRMIECQVVAL